MPPTISLDLCIQYAKRETPQINFPVPSIFCLTLAWKAVILCGILQNTLKISNSSQKIASHPNKPQATSGRDIPSQFSPEILILSLSFVEVFRSSLLSNKSANHKTCFLQSTTFKIDDIKPKE